MMIDDYERVIYYLLDKLNVKTNSVNVVMDNTHQFIVKRPPGTDPRISHIEYITNV